MNYSDILTALNDASTFDLFRLKVAIGNQLKSPKKLLEIKRQLTIGQAVEYFDPASNALVAGSVYQLGRTRVGVRVDATGERWTFPYYWLNLDNSDVAIQNNAKKGMDRNSLKVGDMIGYRSKVGRDIYGKILRLNPKTVTVQLANGEEWRVSYSFLFPVMEGETAEHSSNQGNLLLEGEVIGKKA